jgi:hypothetical protein
MNANHCIYCKQVFNVVSSVYLEDNREDKPMCVNCMIKRHPEEFELGRIKKKR